jgi:hypothetical protein
MNGGIYIYGWWSEARERAERASAMLVLRT